ncbi:MAG TPA: hypothetical protein DCE78_09175 [Bacteroidetes bacterium]|nr:hypothetical protein [Bacteroidota bacterium]
MLFSRVLSWLLHHYYAITLCVLVGFMIGSLYVIWPFQDREYSESIRTEQVDFNDPIIQELQTNPESTLKPEYKKLGPPSKSSETVEILTVKQKLIHSEPFIPLWSKAGSDARLHNGQNSIVFAGVMMLVGIGVIFVIFLLERRKIASKQNESY